MCALLKRHACLRHSCCWHLPRPFALLALPTSVLMALSLAPLLQLPPPSVPLHAGFLLPLPPPTLPGRGCGAGTPKGRPPPSFGSVWGKVCAKVGPNHAFECDDVIRRARISRNKEQRATKRGRSNPSVSLGRFSLVGDFD